MLFLRSNVVCAESPGKQRLHRLMEYHAALHPVCRARYEMSTRPISSKEIKREKHEIDASGEILGRLSTRVARLLSGKDKVSKVPYLDQGDYVVVKNFSKVKVTGKKEKQKEYIMPTRRQGHLRTRTYEEQMNLEPRKVLEHAVKGMLPKNKLGAKMIARLRVEA